MDTVIEKIHKSPLRTSIIATGAGATSIAKLTSVAGCSRTLLDASVPYFNAASAGLIDNYPKRHLSSLVGAELAQYAYHRCQQLFTEDQESGTNAFGITADSVPPEFVGIGCTAAVRTDRSRRGEDGAYISAWTSNNVVSYRIIFSKTDTRAQQEEKISSVIIYALSRCDEQITKEVPEAKQILGNVGIKSIRDYKNETVEQQEEDVLYVETHKLVGSDPYLLLLRKQVDRVIFNSHGLARHSFAPHSEEHVDHNKNLYLLFPGSHNPLHFGHTELARIASETVQKQVLEKTGKKKRVIFTYEISATIVGKRDLRESDLSARVQQFINAGARVAVTREKLFVDKARLFPGFGIVLGIDTAERLLNPKYYNNSREEMIAALEKIREFGCYFVVGGRIKRIPSQMSPSASASASSGNGNGNNNNNNQMMGEREGSTSKFYSMPDSADVTPIWVDCSTLEIPEQFKEMFIPVNQEDFRVDISSTEIRVRRGDCKEMKLYVNIERIYNELRELGIGPTDSLNAETLYNYDQYHYFGTDTVREGAKLAGITKNSQVLDVGSGLGGPARFLAKEIGCYVTAVEIQKDENDVGEDLTSRCAGLSQMITHRWSDFTADNPEFDKSDLGKYDAVVSWLVFVHIADRVSLLRKCFSVLKPGGKVFVEDFLKLGNFTEEEDGKLNHDVHCAYLPTQEQFHQQCEQAGFVNIQIVNYTSAAVQFATERFKGYEGNMERHCRVHGKETAEGMLHFYKTIAELFQGGRFGLCRVLCERPKE